MKIDHPQITDLTGVKFGRLTVQTYAGRNNKGKVLWACQCTCGGNKVSTAEALNRGDTKSCGCIRNPDITGLKFNNFTVIERAGKDRHGASLWKCRCDCGTIKTLAGSSVRTGNIKSCGCLKHRKGKDHPTFHDLTGKRFGELVVVGLCEEKSDYGRMFWECLCDCGNTTFVRSCGLTTGNTKTCGCSAQRKGKESRSWKGGRMTNSQGYIQIYCPEHPNAMKQGYVLEHVKVMSEQLGRALYPKENVHHINGVRDDNRPENLELWTTSQPAGQRVVDKIKWAKEILALYSCDLEN